MWLLNVKTHELQEFGGPDAVVGGYAILSHTWGEEELLFQDLSSLQDLERIQRKKGYLKLHYARCQAVSDGLSYVWIDTCCINKSSSAELSEAINSMFNWYASAQHCYVYLSDVFSHSPGMMGNVLPWYPRPERTVLTGTTPNVSQPNESQTSNSTDAAWGEESRIWYDKLNRSRWFSRGWTLQEMIAPARVKFYAEDWTCIGSKNSLATILHKITGVDLPVLCFTHVTDRPVCIRETLSTFSIARKMKWSAGRTTSRIEDRAYSLLGLFDVNMPLLYGEGNKAFKRLQEEIFKESTDLSIFAWNGDPGSFYEARRTPQHFDHLFAQSPEDFSTSVIFAAWLTTGYSLSKQGLQCQLPILRGDDGDFALLDRSLSQNCNSHLAQQPEVTPALRLERYSDDPTEGPTIYHLHSQRFDDGRPLWTVGPEYGIEEICSRVVLISEEQARRADTQDIVLLRYPPPAPQYRDLSLPKEPSMPRFRLLPVSCYSLDCNIASLYPASFWNTMTNIMRLSETHQGPIFGGVTLLCNGTMINVAFHLPDAFVYPAFVYPAKPRVPWTKRRAVNKQLRLSVSEATDHPLTRIDEVCNRLQFFRPSLSAKMIAAGSLHVEAQVSLRIIAGTPVFEINVTLMFIEPEVQRIEAHEAHGSAVSPDIWRLRPSTMEDSCGEDNEDDN